MLGQKAQLTGANLYLRLNFWVVRCGGQPLTSPPLLTGIEQPAVAQVAISNTSFMFRLNSVPEQAAGLRLVIMATTPQTVEPLPVLAAVLRSVNRWYLRLGL